MVFAVICAGGVGSRMGSRDLPKQFLTLKEKPIIVHTVEKFLVAENFEKIIILCPESWVEYTKEVLQKYIPQTDLVSVIKGGASRNDTIMNAIDFIESNYGLSDDTIIVTHDAVRPFVTSRIIEENISAAKKYGATDTVVPATDTIVSSTDGKVISFIPNRAEMFQGQTPQSFCAKKLKELYSSMSEADKSILTDACKIFAANGLPVYLVKGEPHNIKITYPYDLRVARSLLDDPDINKPC